MTDTELAWAAGLFDGEGSVSIKQPSSGIRSNGQKWHSGHQIRVTIQQNDDEVLKRFQAAVEIGTIYGPYTRPPSVRHRNPYYQYQAHGIEAVKVIWKALWPYLSTVKRDQFHGVLGAWGESHVAA
jgi:hypothetical protein